MTSSNPLDNPAIWHGIVAKLWDNPMHCPFSIQDIAAENGIDAERAYAKFLAHFHHSYAQH
jgi:hypothetical protein